MPDLGQALIDANVLTPAKLKEAMAAGGPLAVTLVEKGFVKEDLLVQTAANAFGVGVAGAKDLKPTAEAIALVEAEIARENLVLPLRKEGNALVLAVSDPGDEGAVSSVAQAAGCSVKVLAASPKALKSLIERSYGGGGSGGAEEIPGPPIAELDDLMKNSIQEISSDDDEEVDLRGLAKLEMNALDPPVVRLVNGVLLKALKMGASDIHIETLEEEMRIRYRIDGKLIDMLRIPGELKNTVASRLKIMAMMDIAERRVPQDGGIKVALGDERQTMDFRCSSLPNIYGEKIVLRVLGNSDLRDSIDDLGFDGIALEWVREAVANPYGMILVTGPTGSGKTTTLYTILNQLNDDDVNIVTAEDPVEYRLAGITQVGVRPAAGLTFDAAMKSFLRQDPDIILVGEMRDYETAAIAVKAALTGHLVLSTVHTNDAPSTVVRLVDMGIEPYLVASGVKLVISQRLLRRICTQCKVEEDMAALERTDLDQSTLASVEALFKGEGCENCNGTGYRGRVPVHEVMAVKTKEMRRAITEGGTEVQVAQIAKREGMVTLAECTIEKVNAGITTIEDAVSVIAAE